MTDLITRLRDTRGDEMIDLRNLCDEAADALEAMQWKPIESVEINGNSFLGYFPDSITQIMKVGFSAGRW